MDVILSWILATALGLGMALLTAPRPMSAVNPGLLWSGPPRRPRTPWMITALLLFGLPCWIVGGLVGCAAHTVSGTWVEVQVRGGMEGAVHAWREVAKEVCDSPAPARPLRVASTGELGVEGSRTTTVSGEAMCGGAAMKPAGIKGVEGTVPVGAVLTVGHKGPSGAPTDTDRFFIVVPQMADGRRDLHPAFAKFNDAAPELRQSIQGNLVHATQAECFEHHLKAQVLPRLVHPMKAPVCTGDGSRAQRWDARAQAFMEIPCPNELCEFRQGQVKACKPWLRLLFQPRWKGGSLPTPLMKLTSASWNNTRAFLGFFEYVQSQATQLGLPELNLYGLPFVLTLSRKTIPTQKRAFPVLSISPDCNLQEYLLLHAQRRAQLTQAPRFVALTDRSQQAPQELLADHSTITPGLPGEVLP